ncbi:MAG: hypothetical protein A4S09_00540 [Proteobacteria bacterium SG_bin7]|nr:MAG: hypothetical protein A4S09_00540 [Proteobacteria bacterium SG_bin7]
MLADRIRKVKPSATLALAAKAKALAAEGKDVVSLTVGEPDWDTFESAKQAGIDAIKSGKTKYMPTEGILELRNLIAAQVQTETGVSYPASQVTVTAGGKFVIFSALQALVNPGDEVIIPAPYWVSYPDMVQLCEGVSKIIECNKEARFKLEAKTLRKYISKKTKAIILNSPSNPTGEVYTIKELQDIAQVLVEFPSVHILTDDIYNRLYFGGEIAPHILRVEPRLKDRTLIVNGVSKSYSMTGWRVGWAVGPKWWIDGMNIYQSQTVSCAASVSQYAAVEALKHGVKDIAQSVSVLRKRRDYFADLLKSVPGLNFDVPGGAFYFWIDISSYLGKSWKGQKINGSMEFVKIFLENYFVATVDGASFGLEGFLRASYATKDEKLRTAVERLKTFVSEIK